MRQEPNNGIDLLLRQMGRRDEPLSPDIDAQHLDADELNSYVANALPAAARARYTAHLADCSSCRKLIATLSASEVPVATTQPVSVVEPSGLKSFLASLLSPMVLRYAVPALGVIVLTVVGIVMLRNDAPDASVAQLQDTEQRALSTKQPSAATPTPAAPAPGAGYVDPNSLLMDSPAQKESRVAKAAPADDAQPVTKSSEPPPPAPKVGDRDYSTQPAEAEKKKADTADENAAVQDARRADEAVKQEQAARKQESVAPAPASGVATGAARTEADRQKLLDNAGAVANFSRDGERSREEYARPRKSEIRAAGKDSGESVTVAGREFRKRGDIWVDTAYTIQAATNVARGSEQYRALVADEPGIHTIAEALKIEFIVVWKGRAYRIR